MKKINQKKIYYDKKTDVLWLNIKSGVEEEHREITPGVSVELGKKGELLGVEIINASKILGGLGFKKIVSTYQTAVPHKIR